MAWHDVTVSERCLVLWVSRVVVCCVTIGALLTRLLVATWRVVTLGTLQLCNRYVTQQQQQQQQQQVSSWEQH
jgi:hypothetical protein